MKEEQDLDFSILEVALNDLAMRTLNSIPYMKSEDVLEALDGIENMMRRGSLAIAAALADVAQAIRETGYAGK